MNKIDFIKHLRSTAEALKPLTLSALSGSATWDGKNYVKSVAKTPEPYALAWWSILGTTADLIEAQEGPLSAKQIAYLKRLLFGGMGSLNDLSFDAKSVGDGATAINEHLNRERRALFASFGN